MENKEDYNTTFFIQSTHLHTWDKIYEEFLSNINQLQECQMPIKKKL